MVDRHLLGDLGLAILIALPVASLALPLPASQHPNVATAKAKTASADRIATSGRISLLG
jgi:hypothetical protein